MYTCIDLSSPVKQRATIAFVASKYMSHPCMCMYVCVYIYMCVCIYIYIYTYIHTYIDLSSPVKQRATIVFVESKYMSDLMYVCTRVHLQT